MTTTAGRPAAGSAPARASKRSGAVLTQTTTWLAVLRVSAAIGGSGRPRSVAFSHLHLDGLAGSKLRPAPVAWFSNTSGKACSRSRRLAPM